MENPFKPLEKDPRKLLITFFAAFAAIGIVAFVQTEVRNVFLVASFGATAVLAYAVPEGPLSQPKNIFFGHLFSAVIGVTIYILLGDPWFAIALAVASAIVVMVLTGTTHPPGGATALSCVYGCYDTYEAVLWIVLFASVIIVIMLIANKGRQYCNEHPWDSD